MTQKFQKGFTLTELLIVIAILVVLTALAIANYKGIGNRKDVELQAQKFVSVLKQAQMMALTGEKIDGSRPNAYGVYIEENVKTYILFADKDNDGGIDGGEEIQTFNLPVNMTFDSSVARLIILFKVPYGSVAIVGASDQKIIIFNFFSESKKVIIDVRTGQIDIQ